MRKLILGILAVVCLQFAFVIYTTLETPVEVAVGPIYSDPQIALPDMSPDVPVPAEEPDPQPEERDAIIETQPIKASSPISAERRRPVTSLSTAEPRLARPRVEEPAGRPAEYFTTASASRTSDGSFETVVISYDRSSAISDCGIEESPKPRKRSYIAKAAPVVKKPWEWIKSIGSKFN